MTTEEYADPNTKEPGLHRIGPAPYDYVFNPAKGQILSFVGRDGTVYTDIVSDFSEDKETGEIRMTLVDKELGGFGPW